MADEKAETGRAFWPLLHKTARSVDEKPTYRQKRRFREFLESMAEIYPCEDCRPGFDWVKKNPPDFSTRKALVAWGCRFHNAINEHLGKPAEDCEAFAARSNSRGCSVCSGAKQAVETVVQMDSKVMMDATKLESEHVPFSDVRAQEIVRKILDYEARRYGVPAPRSVKFQRTEVCPDTSCNVVTNPKRPAESTTIYFYRPEGFNLRSTFHEDYHHIASILGPEAARQKFGPGFNGDPDDEAQADQFAFKEMERLRLNTEVAPQTVRMDSVVDNGNGEQLVVREQPVAMGDIFTASDALYAPITAWAKIPASDLNLQYTPAALERLLETGFAYVATPLGGVVLNLASFALLGGAAVYANLRSYDRNFLSEWAANHLTSLISLAGPGGLAAIAGGAKAAGQAAGRGDGWGAFHQVVKSPEDISYGFRAQMDAVQQIFAPIAKGDAPGGGGGTPTGRQRAPPVWQ